MLTQELYLYYQASILSALAIFALFQGLFRALVQDDRSLRIRKAFFTIACMLIFLYLCLCTWKSRIAIFQEEEMEIDKTLLSILKNNDIFYCISAYIIALPIYYFLLPKFAYCISTIFFPIEYLLFLYGYYFMQRVIFTFFTF